MTVIGIMRPEGPDIPLLPQALRVFGESRPLHDRLEMALERRQSYTLDPRGSEHKLC
jgi:hypothetical protein